MKFSNHANVTTRHCHFILTAHSAKYPWRHRGDNTSFFEPKYIPDYKLLGNTIYKVLTCMEGTLLHPCPILSHALFNNSGKSKWHQYCEWVGNYITLSQLNTHLITSIKIMKTVVQTYFASWMQFRNSLCAECLFVSMADTSAYFIIVVKQLFYKKRILYWFRHSFAYIKIALGYLIAFASRQNVWTSFTLYSTWHLWI